MGGDGTLVKFHQQDKNLFHCGFFEGWVVSGVESRSVEIEEEILLFNFERILIIFSSTVE